MSRDILGNEDARKMREVRPTRRGYEWGQYVTVLEYPEMETRVETSGDGGRKERRRVHKK